MLAGAAQMRPKRLIYFNGDDLARTQAKLLRQRAEAGADLHNAAGPVNAGGLHDPLRHPALREKILPLGFGKMKAISDKQLPDYTGITDINHKKTALPLLILAKEGQKCKMGFQLRT